LAETDQAPFGIEQHEAEAGVRSPRPGLFGRPDPRKVHRPVDAVLPHPAPTVLETAAAVEQHGKDADPRLLGAQLPQRRDGLRLARVDTPAQVDHREVEAGALATVLGITITLTLTLT